MKQPYEILARWNDDGTFSGAHTVRRDSETGKIESPVALGLDKDFPVDDVFKQIDLGLAEKAAKFEAIQKELDVLKRSTAAALNQAKAVIADPEKNDKVTVLEVDAIIKDLTRSDDEKQAATLDEQIASLQEKRDALPV